MEQGVIPKARLDTEKVKIVPREDWGADSSKEEEELDLPVKFITFSTTRTDECYNKEECVKVLRELQKTHKKKGLPDILHNFMVSSNGTVYEGRGWKRPGYPYDEDDGMKNKTIDIAYIGRFKEPDAKPSQHMINKAMALISLGVYKEYIAKKYHLSELDFEW